MKTGFETKSDDVLKTILTNLRSGLQNVLNMSAEEMFVGDGKNVPPSQAAQLNFTLIHMIREEASRRGINCDSFGPDTKAIEDAWLFERLKE